MLRQTPRISSLPSLARRALHSRSSVPALPATFSSTTGIIGRAPAPFASIGRRWASVHVPNSGLDACPSPAEAVGKAAAVKGKGKVWDTADEAIADVKSGSLLLSAGMSLCTVTLVSAEMLWGT